MSLSKVMELYQFFWMFESHAQQRLAWEDAAEARIARERAEALAAAQLDAMLTANPSRSLAMQGLTTKTASKARGCYETRDRAGLLGRTGAHL